MIIPGLTQRCRPRSVSAAPGLLWTRKKWTRLIVIGVWFRCVRMNKYPWIKFYPSDYMNDTRTLTQEEKGCWMDLICHMWLTDTGGEIQITYNELARLWGYEDWAKAAEIIQTIGSKNVCVFGYDCSQDLGCNDVVMVVSRRMVRDSKLMEMNNNRVFKHRHKMSNANVMVKKSEVRSQKEDKDIVPPAQNKSSMPRPTAQEVTDYAQTIGFKINGSEFVDHYEASGWMRGKTKISNWKACVRTWKSRNYQNSINPAHQPTNPVDPAKLAAKEAELEKIKEREWKKRMKDGNAAGDPPWAPPFEVPALKIAQDELG